MNLSCHICDPSSHIKIILKSHKLGSQLEMVGIGSQNNVVVPRITKARMHLNYASFLTLFPGTTT